MKRRNFTKEEKLALYKKYGGRCYLCRGKITLYSIIKQNPKAKIIAVRGGKIHYKLDDIDIFFPLLTVDHFIPLSKGGTNSFDNLRACCKKCNEEKGNHV